MANFMRKTPKKQVIPKTKSGKVVFHSKIYYQKPEIEGSVYGFSGLANNTPFEKYLANSYKLIGFKGFSDHHSFTQNELGNLIKAAKGATLVCTEKDWIKIKDLSGSENLRHITITNKIEGKQDFLTWIKQELS